MQFIINLSLCTTKPTKWRAPSEAPNEDSDQTGHPSSLSAWRKLGPLATPWAHSEDWADPRPHGAVLQNNVHYVLVICNPDPIGLRPKLTYIGYFASLLHPREE